MSGSGLSGEAPSVSPQLVRGLAIRHWFGRWVACLAGGLVLLIIDLFVSSGVEASGPIRLMQGSSLALNGALPTKVPLEQLEGRSTPSGLTLRLDAVDAGFWFGFPLWRGELESTPGAALGPYRLEVLRHLEPPEASSPSVQMRASAPEKISTLSVELLDVRTWREEHPSRLVRWVGLEPGLGLSWLAVLLLGSLCGLFWFAHRLRLELEAQGLSELERLVRAEDGWRLLFRRLSGPAPVLGTRRPLWNRLGQCLGEGVVVGVEVDQLWVSVPLDRTLPSELWIRGHG